MFEISYKILIVIFRVEFVERAFKVNFLSIFFLTVLLRCNWRTTLYNLKVYSIII